MQAAAPYLLSRAKPSKITFGNPPIHYTLYSQTTTLTTSSFIKDSKCTLELVISLYA